MGARRLEIPTSTAQTFSKITHASQALNGTPVAGGRILHASLQLPRERVPSRTG